MPDIHLAEVFCSIFWFLCVGHRNTQALDLVRLGPYTHVCLFVQESLPDTGPWTQLIVYRQANLTDMAGQLKSIGNTQLSDSCALITYLLSE